MYLYMRTLENFETLIFINGFYHPANIVYKNIKLFKQDGKFIVVNVEELLKDCRKSIYENYFIDTYKQYLII